MSSKLQQRALQFTPQPETDELQRFNSMIVPIDRAARAEAELADRELAAPPLTVTFVAEGAAPVASWPRIAVSLFTALLLLPILCVALFPVSILAVVLMPLAGLLYAGSTGWRARAKPRSAARKSDSIALSRAA